VNKGVFTNMKRLSFSRQSNAAMSTRLQRGDALLEALIGVLLTAVIALGLAYSAARILANQSNQTTQGQVLLGMVNQLNSPGASPCTQSTPLPAPWTSVTMPQGTCTPGTVTVTVGTTTSLTQSLTGAPIGMSFSAPLPTNSSNTARSSNGGTITISSI